MAFSDQFKGYFFVALAGILSGTIVFGGKILSEMGLSLFQVSVIPYLLASLIILPFAFSTLCNVRSIVSKSLEA